MTLTTNELVQKILREFETASNTPELIDELGKAAWTAILDARVAQVAGANATKAQIKKINADTTKIALGWDTDNAAFSTVQKIFNRLASGRYADAINLAESSIETKKSADKSAVKENAKNSATKKHAKNNAIINKAMKFYEDNKSSYQYYGGKKRAAYDLESKFPPIKASTYIQHLKKYR